MGELAITLRESVCSDIVRCHALQNGRNGVYRSKSVCYNLGVSCRGKGGPRYYFGDYEGVAIWRQVLHELWMRGIKDILGLYR